MCLLTICQISTRSEKERKRFKLTWVFELWRRQTKHLHPIVVPCRCCYLWLPHTTAVNFPPSCTTAVDSLLLVTFLSQLLSSTNKSLLPMTFVQISFGSLFIKIGNGELKVGKYNTPFPLCELSFLT